MLFSFFLWYEKKAKTVSNSFVPFAAEPLTNQTCAGQLRIVGITADLERKQSTAQKKDIALSQWCLNQQNGFLRLLLCAFSVVFLLISVD